MMFSEREQLLDNPDLDAMDLMLDLVLQAVASGELTPYKASVGLRDLIVAIDSGNFGGVQDWNINGLAHMKR
jgi:hypothetical protein